MKQVFIVEIETEETDFCFSDLKECIRDGSENVGNHTILRINETKISNSDLIVEAFHNEDYKKLEILTGLKCKSLNEFEYKFEELKKRIKELNEVE